MADYGKYGDPVEPWRRIPTRDEPQFRPEPSMVEKVGRWITSDPGMVSPGQVQGLVMKGPTAAANSGRIQELMQKILPGGGTQAEEALAYMKAKYPKITNLVDRYQIKERPLSGGANASVHGQYTTGVLSPKIEMASDLSHVGGAETLGHELTHAVQDARAPRTALTSGYSGSAGDPYHGPQEAPRMGLSGPGVSRPRTVLSPFSPDSTYDYAESTHGYNDNPFEVQARKGGQTALDTLIRFSDLRKAARAAKE